MKNYKDFMACVIAVCITALLFSNKYDAENHKKGNLVYEDETFIYDIENNNTEDNTSFIYQNDVLTYSDAVFLNLLINIFQDQGSIRTDIENQHTLYLNGLDRIMSYNGFSYAGIQYDGYIDLLWDWEQDGCADKLIDARLSADSLAHRIYADDVYLDTYPQKEVSVIQGTTYFKNVYIDPCFKSTRIDESGEYYHVIFYSLTKDRSAINFEKEEDCYIPYDLEVKVDEDGIIYGEGIVSKDRCEELLAEYLKAWMKVFEPEKIKTLRLEDSLEGPQMNL